MITHLPSASDRTSGTTIRRTSPNRAAFTLLEILIAIALLAAIAGLLITNLDRVLGGGRQEVARIFVNETIQGPLMTFRIHVGRYPTTEEGLEALRTKPGDEVSNWQGPYVKSLPNDPWGKPYQYRQPGTHNPDSYDIWSLGPDGQVSDQDIGNWEAGKPSAER